MPVMVCGGFMIESHGFRCQYYLLSTSCFECRRIEVPSFTKVSMF